MALVVVPVEADGRAKAPALPEDAERHLVGRAEEVVSSQLASVVSQLGAVAMAGLVVAYEPVWAIGTGLTPTAADVEEAHAFMRAELTARFTGEGAKMRILYGGSVKPGNAQELMGIANVDGALIGGASLKSDDFLAIYRAYEALTA